MKDGKDGKDERHCREGGATTINRCNCGGGEGIYDKGDGLHYIYCQVCGTSICPNDTEEGALALWNAVMGRDNKAISSDVRKVLEGFKKHLEGFYFKGAYETSLECAVCGKDNHFRKAGKKSFNHADDCPVPIAEKLLNECNEASLDGGGGRMKQLYCWSCNKIRKGKDIKTIDNKLEKPFDVCKWCGKRLQLITDEIEQKLGY